MTKNKDINISPSKGISIIIKNDIQQPLPIKPKKKRRYKRISILPKPPAPIMQKSAGDTSYIKEQSGRFSLWRDNTNSTPVMTLAQATTQGFIPQPQLALPAPQPQPALPAPQQQLALPAPPMMFNMPDYMRAMMQQEFSHSKPEIIESRFKEIDNGLDNDTFYQALPDNKKEEYKDAKLEDITKNIDETAEKAAADIEGTDFYKNKLDATTQATTKEKSKYLTIQQKLEGMKEASIKGIATKDMKNLNEPRYPQNKAYREFYKKGLKNQEDIINTRIQELDVIIATKSGSKKTRAETEKLTKSNDLTKIEDLYNKMKSEKKRIKELLK